ncbi:aldehyde dehydrogenase (NAD+) [Capronia epimyces CBS 606.96]|uniref:Aldehyde dehydrogenase n=1 Tax=Capronia epimyces CBS 606.96 TaxID=1182542 RepID=W9Z6N0_9EURO|nr:aldehyde dehydrogenase (NAD+) [Capronia epimyces CBS 606.96]EXJ90169.1 aldehyde dehydrogenase (NAD+) [Capronia epimyces CBS 606.96]
MAISSTTTTRYSSREEVESKLSTLRKTFRSGKTKDLAFRKWQLKQFWWLVTENEDKICQALAKDLNRTEFETYGSDILGLKQDILDHIEHLEEWAADEIPDAGFLFGTLGKARVRKEPLGVALIIGAWNFPFLLLLQPMIAAIAAGCTVLLKPSELSRETEATLVSLVPQYFDPTAYAIVTGGPQEMQHILSLKFDHIFFTGSASVARHIAAAAAKHLTPTVLELGGRGPAIVGRTADLSIAAKRVAYAKFMNAGQICLSVNHVFVDPAVHDQFVAQLILWNDRFHGADKSKGKGEPSQMGKIVNERHYDRLQSILNKTHGDIVYGGSGDRAALQFKTTVVDGVHIHDSTLSEELFGPILPVIKASTEEAVHQINHLPHPLAIYIFSQDDKEVDYILNNTQSGGVTVNDVMMHAGVHGAPFGGVGESGYGFYHGKYGMEAFSHKRTVVNLPLWVDKLMSFRYPPFVPSNKSKFEVKNRLGFKKGETLKDQKIRKLPRHKVSWNTLLVVALAIAIGWGIGAKANYLTGERERLWDSFRRTPFIAKLGL